MGLSGTDLLHKLVNLPTVPEVIKMLYASLSFVGSCVEVREQRLNFLSFFHETLWSYIRDTPARRQPTVSNPAQAVGALYVPPCTRCSYNSFGER